MGYPFVRIYIYTQKTSNRRRGCDLGGVHHKPYLPTNLYHGGYVALAVAWASRACHEVVIQVVEQITDAIHPHGEL